MTTASEFNRSTQAVRQPGSAPIIVYAAPLDSGYTLNSRLVDSPRAYKTDNRISENKKFDPELWDKLEECHKKGTSEKFNSPIGLVEDLGPQRLINYTKIGNFGNHG